MWWLIWILSSFRFLCPPFFSLILFLLMTYVRLFYPFLAPKHLQCLLPMSFWHFAFAREFDSIFSLFFHIFFTLFCIWISSLCNITHIHTRSICCCCSDIRYHKNSGDVAFRTHWTSTCHSDISTILCEILTKISCGSFRLKLARHTHRSVKSLCILHYLRSIKYIYIHFQI